MTGWEIHASIASGIMADMRLMPPYVRSFYDDMYLLLPDNAPSPTAVSAHRQGGSQLAISWDAERKKGYRSVWSDSCEDRRVEAIAAFRRGVKNWLDQRPRMLLRQCSHRWSSQRL